MKSKIALLSALFAAFAISGAIAQNKNVRKAESSLEDGNLKEAKSYINMAAKDEKTADEAKTWYIKGEVYYALSKKDSMNTTGQEYRDTAFAAFKKTLKLDPKFTGMLLTSYKPLSDLYVDYWKYGANGFNNKNYEAAFHAFKKVKAVNDYMNKLELGMGSDIDTMAVLNIGNAAYNWGKKDSAVKYYQKLADLNFKKESFIYKVLLQEYRDTNEDKFFAVLEKAKKLFPGDQDFTNEEISYYNSKGETDKLVSKLEDVVAQDPQNYNATLNLAISYDNLANPKSTGDTTATRPANHDELFQKAVTYYKKAIDLKPDDYAANFNLGLMYYNAAAHIGTKLGELSSDSKDKSIQDSLLKKQDEYLDEALPYLEKAYNVLDAKPSLTPNEMVAYKNAIIGLQGVYARQSKMDKYNELKKKLDNADSKAQ